MTTILMLDIDKAPIPYERISKVLSMLDLQPITWLVDVKSTTNGWHIIVPISNQLTDLEVVLVQVLMGSDYKRELFNTMRVKQNIKEWNVLFNTKYRNNIEISREQFSAKATHKLQDEIMTTLHKLEPDERDD